VVDATSLLRDQSHPPLSAGQCRASVVWVQRWIVSSNGAPRDEFLRIHMVPRAMPAISSVFTATSTLTTASTDTETSGAVAPDGPMDDYPERGRTGRA
jgi:hypothetical protein